MKRLPVEDLEHIYQNTQDIWESFRGKSIFLTGGTGFFGKWLLESFIYANDKLVLNARITVLSRNPSLFLDKYPFYIEHSEIIFLSGDVVDFQFPDTKFDYVIHAATDTDSESQYKSPLYLSQSIIQGTKRVLELSSLNKVEGFLFTSSGAVYGKQPINIEKVKETDLFYIDLTDPKNTYTESKRIAELYTTIYHKQLGIPNKIARCFAFVGPYLSLDKHFAIGNFIKDAIAGIDISINGNGQTIRSYMYASDLIIWLWKILILGESNSPYNVGSDEAVTLIDVAKNIQNIQNNININITNKLNESGLNNIYVPSISKANEIGLKINVSMAEAIIKTINFYKYDT
jgi:nucleoside-diphosphate-sugar epimerase